LESDATVVMSFLAPVGPRSCATAPHYGPTETYVALLGRRRGNRAWESGDGEAQPRRQYSTRLVTSWARALAPERMAAIHPSGFAACHKKWQLNQWSRRSAKSWPGAWTRAVTRVL